ncbi:MAG: CDP-alcohol phosphatidyltransferase family protein [Clostridia bacterium]|nr:CDP-alcohol phosphatidyltransferase family protein [Clostridia bacterium]
MANIITGIRIVLSVALLFFPAFSPAFYALYLTAGLTDMIDGVVARKTDTESEFGAKLDTVADFVFFASCLTKLLPTLQPPGWLSIWTGLIALIKAVNVVSGFAVRKKWIAPHTVMNKVTGLLLFALPLTVSRIGLEYPAAVVCAVATFAAVQEGHLIRTGRE